ncbi:hypothetical protein ACL9RI_18535 [Janthinobacterium sp. Mn2066]|uniref:hypothetical protein n=1 Tax=Janthinobacterium sp. Mn2066 TaxID=3395264 RepID=UPI003BD77C4C
MADQSSPDWTLIPGSSAEIGQVRERCRSLVRRRAAMSAGASAIPIPGIDLMSDVGLLSMLINDINHEFGLTPEQIERLNPQFKLMAYRAAVGMGGMLVGKLVTRELLMHLLKRSGIKIATKQVARFVPFAGQAVAAALGYAVFRQIGYQHVNACAAVAQELTAVRPR